jgi:hypothetical protein
MLLEKVATFEAGLLLTFRRVVTVLPLTIPIIIINGLGVIMMFAIRMLKILQKHVTVGTAVCIALTIIGIITDK